MRLDIYIADHCENCQEALRLAELARAASGAEVRVINVDTTTEAVPARVVATPMYLLDGRVVSMGNPYPDDLLRMLGLSRAESDQENGPENRQEARE
jgi:thioredoxin family protein